MRARPHSPSLVSVCVLVLATFVGLSGCCTTKEAAPQPFPGAVENEESAGPTEVVIHCADFEPRACCDAESRECEACHAKARDEQDAWAAQCQAPQAESETAFDCGAPPPLTPCCRALLPRCTECAAENRRLEAAYEATCAKGAVAP